MGSWQTAEGGREEGSREVIKKGASERTREGGRKGSVVEREGEDFRGAEERERQRVRRGGTDRGRRGCLVLIEGEGFVDKS